jgi:thioredoxin-related protein
MRKKTFFTVGFIVLFAFVLFMIYGIVEKVSATKLAAKKIQTLSITSLYKMDSTRYQITALTPILLIYFNTGCEHCQYELAEVKKKLPTLQSLSILFMSSENISEIQKAARDWGLTNLPNVEFLKINRDNVFENFGSLSVPHLFLYSKNRSLIKEFKGETKLEAILQYLP